MLPNALKNVGLPSSSGYSVYSALRHPVYAAMFTKRMYAESLHGRISSTSVVPAELRRHGDIAIFRRPPRGKVFKYTKNRDLDVSLMNSTTFSFKVDKAWYTNLKLDEVDLTQLPEIRTWIKLFMDDAMEQQAAEVDHDMLQTMVADAHACNKGAAAGLRTHSYNLGKVGAPLKLSAAGAVNPLTLTAVLAAVLGEQNIRAKDLFVVWPSTAQPLFLATPILSNAYQSGLNKSALITGDVAMIGGYNHYFSANIPTYLDPVTNEVCYPVILGRRTAMGYVQQLSKNQVITEDARSFSTYFRSLYIAGWGVVAPEELVVAYVTVAPIF